MIFWYNIHGKAVPAAKNNCRRTCRKSAKGGKAPLLGGVRLPVQASLGWSPRPFTRRTISAVSAANECEGITCLWQVTRNDSDEAERRERSPPGVVSVANVEGLAGAARQVRPARAAANGSASQVNVSSDTSGEVRRASGPPEPSANDRHPICGL